MEIVSRVVKACWAGGSSSMLNVAQMSNYIVVQKQEPFSIFFDVVNLRTEWSELRATFHVAHRWFDSCRDITPLPPLPPPFLLVIRLFLAVRSSLLPLNMNVHEIYGMIRRCVNSCATLKAEPKKLCEAWSVTRNILYFHVAHVHLGSFDNVK